MDRRKSGLFWKILNLVVNLTFLLLAITIMTILLRNDAYRQDYGNYANSILELKQELSRVNQSNFTYLESKINRVASSQDSYQVNTSNRIDVLESRQQVIESRKRDNTRINNTNTAIVNGSKE